MLEIIDLWLDEAKWRGLSQGTRKSYRQKLLKLNGFLGDQAQKITPESINTFLFHYLKCTDEGRGGYWRAIRVFYRWASAPDRNYLDPAALAGYRPRLARRRRPMPWDRDKILAVINSLPRTPAGRRDRLALLTIYYTGGRANEVLNLRRRDLNLEAGMVNLFGQKTGEWRMVPMVKPLIIELAAWLGRIKGREGYVFPRVWPEDGRRVSLSQLEHNWKRYQTANGLKADETMTLHDLRHAFATHSKKAGLDPFELKELLGHKNLSTTLGYWHEGDKVSLQEKMNKALEKDLTDRGGKK
jgi:integrase/recombinase XerC